VGLNALQDRLERLYDLRTPHRVEDFLLHDPALLQALTGTPHTPGPPEQLVLVQDGEAVDVGLFLERGLLERLSAEDPAADLRADNLQDFCVALEGVSHFLLVAWAAGHERRVTLFELELQAEVDKYVTTAALLASRRGERRRLRRALFEEVRFRPGLAPDALHRYREANRLAARYCGALDERFELPVESAALTTELRRFYRLPREAKVRHIEAGGRRR
jgi:hypothetical protein